MIAPLKKVFLLVILFFQLGSLAQNVAGKQSRKDSLRAKLKADSIHIYRFQKFRPYVNLDQRISFIRDNPISVNGVQIGTLINNIHVAGIGGYVVTSTSKQRITSRTTGKDMNVERQLGLKYATLFYQYTAVDKRYFELDLQAELGGGKYDLNLYNDTNKLLVSKSAGIFVSGLGPLIAIKPFRWIGISAMAGYRFTYEKSNLNFNGAFYGYGAWLDIRQILRDVNYYLVKKRKYRKELSILSTRAV